MLMSCNTDYDPSPTQAELLLMLQFDVHCMLCSLYAMFIVCYVHCMLCSLYAMFIVCYVHCMLCSLYAMFIVCYVHCMLCR